VTAPVAQMMMMMMMACGVWNVVWGCVCVYCVGVCVVYEYCCDLILFGLW